MINVESDAELKRVEIIAKELGKSCKISIRVNPNIDPKHIHIFLQDFMKINLELILIQQKECIFNVKTLKI